MNKKDWLVKEKEFLEMQTKANSHKKVIEQQLEELEVFLEAIRAKTKTFK